MWRRRVRAGDVRYGCTPIPGRLEYRDLESATHAKVEARVARGDREPGTVQTHRTRRRRAAVRSGRVQRAVLRDLRQ